MPNITVYDGIRKDLLKDFEDEQWPIADRKHFGDDQPDFTKQKFTIVAEEGSQLVGFIKLEIDMGVATINSLLVHNKHQRQGVGSALLDQAEKLASTHSCHKIIMETGETWEARAFYEAQGYTVAAHLKKHYGKQDFVLLEKQV